MTIFQTLRTTFDVCKSLPKVSPSLRFFSVSQVAYEPPQDDLNAKISKRREYLRQYHEACRFKSNVDPEYRRQRRESLSAIDRRYYQNPDHHEIIKLKRRILYARRVAENPHLYARYRLHLWLNRHAWVRDELDWKAHKPVWSPVKVTRTCESCNIEKYGGSYLWWVRMRECRWPELGTCYDLTVLYLRTRNMLNLFSGGQQRKYDPSLFDCTTCFFGPNPDPRHAYPRGCEDVTTIRELRTRKQELDRGLKPGSLSQNKSAAV
jgi:hypothetical protein